MLDETTLRKASDILSKKDPHLGQVIDKYGYPPLWNREPGYPTLIKIILEQQVSLASAQAAFSKLNTRLNPLIPENFLTLDDRELREISFSRQKTRYVRILSNAIIDGNLDLEGLKAKSDEDVMKSLTAITGIGPWTAGIYLLLVLRRPDIWPKGDLALQVSMKEVLGLETRPTIEEAEEIAVKWRPWRSVASRILWHSYLSNRENS